MCSPFTLIALTTKETEDFKNSMPGMDEDQIDVIIYLS